MSAPPCAHGVAADRTCSWCVEHYLPAEAITRRLREVLKFGASLTVRDGRFLITRSDGSWDGATVDEVLAKIEGRERG